MTDDETAPHEPVTPATLSRWPLPEIGGGKENKGRLLVVGGARQTPGAVLLATQAALRVGAGKVQLATAAPNATALACALPEAYVEGLPVHESGDLDVLTGHVDRRHCCPRWPWRSFAPPYPGAWDD